MATRTCTRCRAQTEPAALESAAGESEPVGVKLRDMPMLTCPSGHRQFGPAGVRPQAR